MVPINEYACNAIAKVGRTNQISPTRNGKSRTTCRGAPAGSPKATGSAANPTSTTTVLLQSPAVPVLAPPQKAAAHIVSVKHLSGVEADTGDELESSSSFLMLNCTMSTQERHIRSPGLDKSLQTAYSILSFSSILYKMPTILSGVWLLYIETLFLSLQDVWNSFIFKDCNV